MRHYCGGLVVVMTVMACGHSSHDHGGNDAGAVDDDYCVPYEVAPGQTVCLQHTPTGDTSATIADDTPHITDLNTPGFADHWNEYLKGCLTVHDQMAAGWCTANSATAAMEGLHCSPAGGHKSTRISEPHLWWLGHGMTDFTDVSKGWQIANAMDVATQASNFILDANVWPEYAPDFTKAGGVNNAVTMNMSRPAATVLALDGVHGANARLPLTGLTAIKAALDGGYEVTIAVPIVRGSGWNIGPGTTGAGEIFDPDTAQVGTKCDCTKAACAAMDPFCYEGYHAVTLVGYDDTTGKVLMLNSWGPNVGIDADGDGLTDGLYHITYGYITRYAFDANRYDVSRDRPPRFTQLSTSYNASCGIGTNKITYCWGGGPAHDVRDVPGDPAYDLDVTYTGDGPTNSTQTCYDMPNSGTVLGMYPFTLDSYKRCGRSPTPVGTASFTAVATGQAHACALDTTGLAYCWGDNTLGQLGNGTVAPAPNFNAGTSTTVTTIPTQIVSTTKFVSIYSFGNHTCALDAGGAATCWGDNSYDELGATTTPGTPVAVATSLAFTSLALSGTRTCGITTANDVYCWGAHPQGGALCGSSPCTLTPILLASSDKYRQVVITDTQTTLLSTSGAVTTTSSLATAPAAVTNLPALSYTALSTTAFDATCAIDTTGALYCWGKATYGAVGNGSFTDNGPSKVDVPPVTSAGGGVATCALDQQGYVRCWGHNLLGSVGAEVPACAQDSPSSVMYYTAPQCTGTPTSLGGL